MFAITDVSERRNLERLTKDFLCDGQSHDIRSPLHAIDNTLEIALSKKYGSLGVELSERLSGARAQYNPACSSWLNKLLVIEKLEGAVEFDLVKVEFSEAIEGALDLYKQKIESRHLNIEVDCKSVYVLADKQYLMQVTSNLLENAIKYSPEGSRILLNLTVVDDFAELAIRDQGPGVTRDMREAIFDRFRQAPSSAAAAHGFGLGLAICKQIVEKHGGTIGVRDVPSNVDGWARSDIDGAGKGCEFWVRFKLYSEPANETCYLTPNERQNWQNFW